MLKLNDRMTAKLDLMEPHVEHLTRMRDLNRPMAEVLHWLWTQGVKIHGGHITAFWQRRAERAANPPTSGGSDPSQPQDSAADESKSHASHPSYASHGNAHPHDRPPSPLTGEGGRRPDEVNPSPKAASDSAAASDASPPRPISPATAAARARSAKFAGMMDKYLDYTNELMDKCRADPNAKLEDRQQLDRMMQIAIDYERSQWEQEQRQKAFELKQAEYELKARRLALMEKREEEKIKAREAAAEREPPTDFDNTDLIADMRGEMFKEVFTPENIARADAALAKATAHLDPNNNPNLVHHW